MSRTPLSESALHGITRTTNTSHGRRTHPRHPLHKPSPVADRSASGETASRSPSPRTPVHPAPRRNIPAGRGGALHAAHRLCFPVILPRCLHLGSSGGRLSRRIFLRIFLRISWRISWRIFWRIFLRISWRIFWRISRPRGSLCAACPMPSPTAAHPHLLRLRSMVNEVLSHPVDCDSCRDSKGLS